MTENSKMIESWVPITEIKAGDLIKYVGMKDYTYVWGVWHRDGITDIWINTELTPLPSDEMVWRLNSD